MFLKFYYITCALIDWWWRYLKNYCKLHHLDVPIELVRVQALSRTIPTRKQTRALPQTVALSNVLVFLLTPSSIHLKINTITFIQCLTIHYYNFLITLNLVIWNNNITINVKKFWQINKRVFSDTKYTTKIKKIVFGIYFTKYNT